MKLTESLRYTNSRGESITLANTLASEVWWATASGLDELSNNVSTFAGIGQHGETVTSMQLPGRPIDIMGKIRANEDYWRSRIVRVFNPTLAGNLVYKDSARGISRYIEVRITETPDVEDKPFPRFAVEFYAPYPLWLDGTGSQRVTDIATWLPGICFPIEGIEIPETGYDMGTRSPSLIVNVSNKGDVESGIRFVFKAQGSVSTPQIVNVETQEHLKVNVDMIAGDVLTVTTGYGNMRARLVRNNVETNVFNTVTDDSTWLQLHVGDNLLRYAAADGEDNLNVSIYYDYAYMGARR